MSRIDYESMQEALDTLNKYKTWLPIEVYTREVKPVTDKLRDRLSTLDSRDLKRIKLKVKDPLDIDTVPQSLLDVIETKNDFRNRTSE